MPTIRKAKQCDAAALARVAEQTFRNTFANTNSAEDMELHCQNNFGAEIQAQEINSPSIITLLCEEEESTVGFAQLRLGYAPDFVSARSPVEIQRLYLTEEWHGKGIAQALMAACIDEASASIGCDLAGRVGTQPEGNRLLRKVWLCGDWRTSLQLG